MARQAGVVQARPMTLSDLARQIQAAVEPQGWTAALAREGDALIVDLMGPVCPDPLLAMVMVQAELEQSDAAGLEVIKLCGHVAEGSDEAECDPTAKAATHKRDAELTRPTLPSWVSVIDLDRYFAQRAELTPEAFGLSTAEASRMACAAERDRIAYPSTGSKTPQRTDSPSAAPAKGSSTDTSSASDSSELPDSPEASLTNSLGIASAASQSALVRASLPAPAPNFEDPWELEPPEPTAPLSDSTKHFPLISPAQAQAIARPGYGAQAGRIETGNAATAERNPLAPRTGYDHYREFIAHHSSWFAQTVKDNPRLHELAKQRQHYTIGTLSHYLVETLAENERLVDLIPAQKRDRGCGLIFTDQRAIALSQPSRRNRQGLQVWVVPWDWVHKIEICQDALRFHYGRSRERFSVDLESPYHLRNAIPREIPVRMVQTIASTRRRTLETKAGLTMIAGVMFALGSGFSLLSTVAQQQQVDARSSSLAASSSEITADASELAVTTSPVQCVDSFNAIAQPHAYATFNQVTQTLQVNLQKQVLAQMPQQQFDQMAAVVAEEVLTSCQAKVISQVVVTNGTRRYQQQRATADFTSMQFGE